MLYLAFVAGASGLVWLVNRAPVYQFNPPDPLSGLVVAACFFLWLAWCGFVGFFIPEVIANEYYGGAGVAGRATQFFGVCAGLWIAFRGVGLALMLAILGAIVAGLVWLVGWIIGGWWWLPW